MESIARHAPTRHPSSRLDTAACYGRSADGSSSSTFGDLPRIRPPPLNHRRFPGFKRIPDRHLELHSPQLQVLEGLPDRRVVLILEIPERIRSKATCKGFWIDARLLEYDFGNGIEI